MAELKFIKPGTQERASAYCETAQGTPQSTPDTSCRTCSTDRKQERPTWITGFLPTDAGAVPIISTDLTGADYWEHVKCRVSDFRNSFIVPPGLYAVGAPDKSADVFVSANYKLSFDVLRKALKGLNAWLLVLDTKGINVWCAAGKGTFGTAELIQRISVTKLDRVVEHRRVIVPQLGAPGISAHVVKKVSGFKVSYGPVRAEDVGAYVAAGYKGTREMRTVKFPLIDRLVLTPMEINPAMKKYFPAYAIVILAIFSLQPEGLFFKDALNGGLPFLLLGMVSILTGALVTPALLPFVPSRSFAVKGWIMGMVAVILAEEFITLPGNSNAVLLLFTYLFFPLASSYIALQFTGSTTFTGMSGVKKELKVSVPIYILGIAVSIVLLAIFKVGAWRLI